MDVPVGPSRRCVACLFAGALVFLPSPVLALSASELAGPGQGFQDPSLARDQAVGSGAIGSGILGGLSAGAANNAPDVRLSPVPDRLSPTGATAAFPSSRGFAPAPVAVPTPRLRPVPDQLPVSGAYGGVGPALRPPAPAPAPPAGVAPFPGEPATDPQTRTDADPGDVPSDEQEPTLIRADTLQHERDLGIYTARGNVELSTGDRLVMADMVAYNEQADTFTANGNVRVIEGDGTTYFANFVELSSDFKDGFVRDISILLQDRSRISGVYATRTNGERKDFYKAVYTACDTCATEESALPTITGNQSGTRERIKPLWAVRAAHTTHDEVNKDIIYRDAVIEMLGLPVFYTPYMSMPDPTVYRRTGFLNPVYGNSNVVGYWLEVPYYIVIDDHQDLTLRPRASLSGDVILQPEYRMNFTEGTFFVDGSIGRDSEKGLGVDITTNGSWHINPIWRTGFEGQYYSSDVYMDRHSLGSPNYVNNAAFLEAFDERSFATLRSEVYTDMRENQRFDLNDFVLPYMLYDYVGDPVLWGGSPLFEASVQGIILADGLNSYRWSGDLGWTRTGLLSGGLLYDVEASLSGDMYLVEKANQDFAAGKTGYDGAVARGYPSARVGVRYPFVRRGRESTQTFEPVVTLAAAPPGLNTKRIPNLDSQSPELSISNLFTGDRTTGRDLVDDGISVSYGGRWSYVADSGPSISAELGQAYRFFDDGFFGVNSGYGDGLSDVVGLVDFRPHPWLDAQYQFRAQPDEASIDTNLVNISAGPPALRMSATYVQSAGAQNERGDTFGVREQISGGISAIMGRYWRSSLSGTYDLANERAVNVGATLFYEDECVLSGLRYRKSFNRTSTGEQDQTILFTLTLKTIGNLAE